MMLLLMMLLMMVMRVTGRYTSAVPIQEGCVLLPQQYAQGLDALSRQGALEAQEADGGWQLTHQVTQQRILLHGLGRGEAQAADLRTPPQGGQQGRVEVTHVVAITEHQ